MMDFSHSYQLPSSGHRREYSLGNQTGLKRFTDVASGIVGHAVTPDQ